MYGARENDAARAWKGLPAASRKKALAAATAVDVLSLELYPWAEDGRARGEIVGRTEKLLRVRVLEPGSGLSPYGEWEFTSGGLTTMYLGAQGYCCVPADWELDTPRVLQLGPWFVGLRIQDMTNEELLAAFKGAREAAASARDRIGEGANNPTRGRGRARQAGQEAERIRWEVERRKLDAD